MQISDLGINKTHLGIQGLNSADKIEVMAMRLLRQVNDGKPLKDHQRLYIKASSDYLPLVYKLEQVAYRVFGSDFVSIRLIEPEFEKLKAKYGGKDFDYHQEFEQHMKTKGAAVLELSNDRNYFQEANLSPRETNELKASIQSDIDEQTKKILELDTDEVFETCLGYEDGDALYIEAARDHMHQALQVAEAAYQKGTQKIDLKIMDELPRYDLRKPLALYGSEHARNEPDFIEGARRKEYIKEGCPRLIFDGDHPYQFDGLGPSAHQNLSRRSSFVRGQIQDIMQEALDELPWCIYYSPTPLSAKAAGYTGFREAAIHAAKITRKGELKAHIKKMQGIRDKINSLLEQGYNTIHYQSMDPKTRQADGKTDLYVELTNLSQFVCMGSETKNSKKKYTANVPSEETFSTPHRAKTRGKLCATRPAFFDGKKVDGIELEFGEDGKVDMSKVKASTNEDVLINWLNDSEEAKQLGEAALVAGSQIFDTGLIFDNVLLDENATCHVALGSCHKRTIKGALDLDAADAKNMMREAGCNVDLPMLTHSDIMIGDQHMKVSLEDGEGDKEAKVLIENNQFVI